MQKYSNLRRDIESGGIGSSESDVMISVHEVKTMLMKRKKKKKGVFQQRISLRPELQITKISILAIGTPEKLGIPQNFCYYDPMNCWKSKSRFVTSSVLKAAITNEWQTFRQNNDQVPESVAKHIMLDEKLETISPCQGASKGGVKFEVDDVLEFLSHGPDPNSLDNVLKRSLSFDRDRNEWLSTKNDEIFAKIKSSFFDESKLPTSFKFDTTKFKHHILLRPNQLGADSSSSAGKLRLLCHDQAHIKFTEREIPAQNFDDRKIKEKLENSSTKKPFKGMCSKRHHEDNEGNSKRRKLS